MPNIRGRKAHFYDNATVEALKGVSLPEKIKCGRCNKFKSQISFSATQLTDARSKVKEQGSQARYTMNCKPCTSQQVVEIECTVCNKTKGLDEYARSQRKRPDEAECFACVEDRLGQTAINEEVYTGDDRTTAIAPSDEDVATKWPTFFDSSTTTESSEAEWKDAEAEELGGISFSADFAQKLSMSGDQETLIETEYEHGSQVFGDGDWQTVPTKSWHTKSYQTPSTNSGWDPKKYGKPPARSSCGSVSGSVQTFSSGYAERDTASFQKGWARIKAYDPRQDPANQSPVQPAQKEEEEDWSSDDEKAQAVDDDDSDDTDTEI